MQYWPFILEMWNKALYYRKAIKRRLPLLFMDTLTLSGAGLSCKT